MPNDDNLRSESRTPTIREELEGFVRSLFSPADEATIAPKLISPPPPPPPPPPPTPMLDADKGTPTNDRTPDVAEQVAGMLRDLFETQDTFLISNAGVQAIIDGLLRRYRARESAALREKLLAHWRQDVSRLRAALLEQAADDPLVLDTGQEVSLVTTQKAQALLDRFCPQTSYLPDTRGARDVR
jgi:hypothetical protein